MTRTTTTEEPERLLVVREVAELLRFNQKTVYEMAAAGRLPCIRIGGRLRFHPGDLTKWLEARKEG